MLDEEKEDNISPNALTFAVMCRNSEITLSKTNLSSIAFQGLKWVCYDICCTDENANLIVSAKVENTQPSQYKSKSKCFRRVTDFFTLIRIEQGGCFILKDTFLVRFVIVTWLLDYLFT